jgi:hypothetical protein
MCGKVSRVEKRRDGMASTSTRRRYTVWWDKSSSIIIHEDSRAEIEAVYVQFYSPSRNNPQSKRANREGTKRLHHLSHWQSSNGCEGAASPPVYITLRVPHPVLSVYDDALVLSFAWPGRARRSQ